MIPTDWVPVTNVAAVTIPSFGVAIVTGQDEFGNLEIDEPDTDNDTGVVVLGAGAVTADGFGEGTFDARCIVAYEEADGTPAAGEEWGVKAGNYKLREGYSGFRILGGAANGLVNAVRVSSGSVALSFSTAYLTADYNISAEATWEYVTGLTITVPATGVYHFVACVTGYGTLSTVAGSPAGRIEAALYNNTTSRWITDPSGTGAGTAGGTLLSVDVVNMETWGAFTMSAYADATASDVIRVMARKSKGHASNVWSAATIDSATGVGKYLQYARVA